MYTCQIIAYEICIYALFVLKESNIFELKKIHVYELSNSNWWYSFAVVSSTKWLSVIKQTDGVCKSWCLHINRHQNIYSTPTGYFTYIIHLFLTAILFPKTLTRASYSPKQVGQLPKIPLSWECQVQRSIYLRSTQIGSRICNFYNSYSKS